MNTLIMKSRVVLMAAIALSISACATSLTSTFDKADDVDLTEFKTYAWINAEPLTNITAEAPQLTNPVNQSRLRANFDAALQSKGYVKVPLAEADLAVSYTLGARDSVRVRNYYNDVGYNYYNGFGRFGNRFGSRFGSRFGRFGRFGGDFSRTTVRTVTDGTVAVDIFDNKSREAIWHGAASKRLSGSDSGRKLVTEAAGTLLEGFPQSSKMTQLMRDKMDDTISS